MTDYEQLFAVTGFSFFSTLLASFATLSVLPAEDKLWFAFCVAGIYALTQMFTDWCAQVKQDDHGKGKVAVVCAAASPLALALKPF